jgi:hypothetical protein
VTLLDFDSAAREALSHLHPARIERVWDDGARPARSLKHEGFFIEHGELQTDATPEALFRVLTSMGGTNGWPFANWLWKLRGWIDGFFSPWRHGDTKPQRNKNFVPSSLSDFVLKPGDKVDYYTVEAIEPNRLLLHADLRAPGEGWMEWRVGRNSISTYLTQTAYFAPRGLGGFVYWYTLYPFHQFVFRGLIHAIARKAKEQTSK